jgi:DNA topoisomerase-3
VVWKKKASKTLPAAVVRELMASLSAAREAGEVPGTGKTEKPVTGFKGRSGRTFRAKLKLEQKDEGKWRVEFDEEWAKEPPPGEADGDAGAAGAAAIPSPDGGGSENGAAVAVGANGGVAANGADEAGTPGEGASGSPPGRRRGPAKGGVKPTRKQPARRG